MNILFYTTAEGEQRERLQRVIEVLFPKKSIEICSSLDVLKEILHQPFKHLNVAVFFPSNERELADLLPMRDLLYDMRIILILPDRARDTVSMGHTLRPRLISYSDSDFLEVAAVLGRMMERRNPSYQADEWR